MKAEEALDNPVWYALTGPHASLVLSRGRARHYPLDVAPFSSIEAGEAQRAVAGNTTAMR
jgi:hypothetical protein